MQLRYISVPHLIAEAGGDPWAINRSLQNGRPAQISGLAQAFHDAGLLTNQAESAFNEARGRFEAAWNRENGDHPINDAAEVQRATRSLGVQAGQLPKIAVDLEGVAASLAEAQRSAGGQIATLEGQLEDIDRDLGAALELEKNGHLTEMQRAGAGYLIHSLEQRAIDETTATLHQAEHIRDRYSEQLRHSMTTLRVQDGYDAALVRGLDGHELQTADQAETDVHAALAGNQAAAARVDAVLDSITAEQLAGKLPLSAEQASVLSQLQAQQHGMSIDALWVAEQRLGDQREMVGNSWQLMSNPAILFPRTDLQPGAKQGGDTLKGGAAQLPDGVQDALTASWALTTGQMSIISNIVRDGNPSFQTNTELDRRMIRQASVTMDAATFQHDAASNGRTMQRDRAFDPVIANVLAAVSPDHQVVHDMLTGPDHENFLHNVTNHFWLDNGKDVALLFDWTESAALGPEARLAGETAHAYSTYVGTHEPELLHLPGNHTVGEINPNLVQGMARGLTPYVNNIAGTSGGLAEFGNFTDNPDDIESGKMPVGKGIFSVLSTDKAASDHFNGAADRQAVIAESTYAQALASHAPNMDSYNANLHDAMTLRGLVNAGIHNAVQGDAENHHIAQEAARRTEYDRGKSAYELGVKTLTAAAGVIPGAGLVAGPGVGIIGSALESDFVGPPPSPLPLPTDHPLPNMSIGRADREILNAVIASGQHVEGVPPQYLINGRIGTPDELEQLGRYGNPGDYDHALSQAMTNVFAQDYGIGLGRPVIPDRDMIDRYNAVTEDPDPLKK